jgi:hypothetical protein
MVNFDAMSPEALRAYERKLIDDFDNLLSSSCMQTGEIEWDPVKAQEAWEEALVIGAEIRQEQEEWLKRAAPNAERVRMGLPPIRGDEGAPEAPKRGRGRPRKVRLDG